VTWVTRMTRHPYRVLNIHFPNTRRSHRVTRVTDVTDEGAAKADRRGDCANVMRAGGIAMKEREYRDSKLRPPTEDAERERAMSDLETRVRALQHRVQVLEHRAQVARRVLSDESADR
jgi:hypothetical protein